MPPEPSIEHRFGTQRASHGRGQEAEHLFELLVHPGNALHVQLVTEELHRIGVIALNEECDVQGMRERKPGSGGGKAQLLQPAAPGSCSYLSLRGEAFQGAYVGRCVQQSSNIFLVQIRGEVACIGRPPEYESAETHWVGKLPAKERSIDYFPA
jgi:hypothetical protein